MPKNLFRRIQLRRVGRQRQRDDPVRPDHCVAAITAGSIPHDADPLIRPFFTQRRGEEIQAERIARRYEEAPAFPALRRDRDGDPDPLIPIIKDPRGTMANARPTPPTPLFQSASALVKRRSIWTRGAAAVPRTRCAQSRHCALFSVIARG